MRGETTRRREPRGALRELVKLGLPRELPYAAPVSLPNEKPAAAPAYPNVYFVGLELSDVRCFEGAHWLDLSDKRGGPARWTLLLGENGVGKTTLLELLEALRPARSERLNARPAMNFAAMLHPSGSTNAFYTFGRADSARWTFKMQVKHADSLSSPSVPTSVIEFDGKVAVESSGTTLLPEHVVMTTYGYGASRRVGTSVSNAAGRINDASVLLSEAESLQNPERWFLDASLSANQPSPHQERAKAQLARVEAILTRVLPDISGVRVGIVDRAGEITPTVEVNSPDGWVPYAALSIGYRTTTAWMVDLAIRLFNRYPNLADPLTGAAVCLVDEIDLHLHPRWQRSLMSTLSEIFPNVQFIATAHSPLMVQSAKDANVVVLRRENGRVVIDNNPPNVEKWRVDQILTSALFGLPSARAAELDAALEERDTLLGKSELTAEDETRLAALSKVIGAVPYGETPEDIEASNTVRLAAKQLAKSS